jgi:hypothetical protein
MDQYQVLFGELPKTNMSPFEPNDHPELDDTKLCNPEQITQYQSMIGALQWLISLGKFDIFTAVMTMSRFRIDPREGHLNRLKRIYGYVRNTKDSGIRYQIEQPDYSGLPPQVFTWSKTIYGEVRELIPKNAPPTLGKEVVLLSYVNANLIHNQITGRCSPSPN